MGCGATVRGSERVAVPDGVADVLLWRLAVDVLAAHQADGAGSCGSLLCSGEVYPCRAARTAQRAMDAACAGEPFTAAVPTDLETAEHDQRAMTGAPRASMVVPPLGWFGNGASVPADRPPRGLGLAGLYRRGSTLRWIPPAATQPVLERTGTVAMPASSRLDVLASVPGGQRAAA